jgi:hypothetical protein
MSNAYASGLSYTASEAIDVQANFESEMLTIRHRTSENLWGSFISLQVNVEEAVALAADLQAKAAAVLAVREAKTVTLNIEAHA